jgi:xanthine dehydrogenase accessory factor
MMEDTRALREVVERADRGERFAVALVLHSRGSTPRRAGTRAIIDERGRITGTIGGGITEAEAQRRAVQVIAAGRATTFDMDFGGRAAGGGEPICGGYARILLDPVVSPHRDACAMALAFQGDRRPCVLVTSIAGDQVSVECVDAAQWRDEPAAGLQTDRLIEPVAPPPRLLIIGGGHVGRALAAHAELAGFEVVVIDDRPEFADARSYPQSIRTHCAPAPQALAEYRIDPETSIAIVTRGHRLDTDALAACINSPAGYIGMMGSHRKVALVRRHLLEAGLAAAQRLDRIHAPIGLEIGAQSVPEIAVSIVAQLIAARRGRA